MLSYVSIERSGRIAVVRFDRGDGRNALSRALIRELTAAARSFEEDGEVSAVILTGSAQAFSVGYDLKDPSVAEASRAGLMQKRLLQQSGPRLCRAFEEIDAVTICAIEGWCIGGGVALAVACDFRVAARDATFYVPEIERGMNMSWQSLPRMVALMGPARTKQLAILAEKVPAEQALAWGLIEETTEPGGALSRAMAMAERIAALPPVPVRMIKRGVSIAAGALGHATSYMDADQFVLAQTGEDFAEGVNSFLERRKPRFTGR
ncbi:MAG: enoyl-CoA hydratase/isomerase family protein [Alphaproteobacteria bacterium]|nr:enoyl-CoA hydratase/isomerase family protein [Alphaproteobacteria bacterium]